MGTVVLGLSLKLAFFSDFRASSVPKCWFFLLLVKLVFSSLFLDDLSQGKVCPKNQLKSPLVEDILWFISITPFRYSTLRGMLFFYVR